MNIQFNPTHEKILKGLLVPPNHQILDVVSFVGVLQILENAVIEPFGVSGSIVSVKDTRRRQREPCLS